MAEVRFDGVMPIPRAEVFDFLVDARNWPTFVPGVETVATSRAGARQVVAAA